MEPLRFYDFFAGAGMADLALAPEWRCVWANDIDPRKAAIYTANHGSAHFHLGDVARVASGDLPTPADMAWASFPCQDLSLAGWRRGMRGERSGTFWHFHRIMRDLHAAGQRPPLLVLENVVGLLQGPDFVALCEALVELDLQFGALVIDAARFVPQSRPRVFVVAADRAIDAGAFTRANPGPDWTSPALLDACHRLPPATRQQWRWWHVPAPGEAVAPVAGLIEDAPASVRWHSAPETARLLALMSPRNLAKVASAQESPARSVGFLYRRTRNGQQRAEVRFDGVAGCLRTPAGGSSRQTLLVVEGRELRSRLLSAREAARLMGIPDEFALPGSYNDVYHAMGDGVAAPVVRWLGEHLLTPLARVAREG